MLHCQMVDINKKASKSALFTPQDQSRIPFSFSNLVLSHLEKTLNCSLHNQLHFLVRKIAYISLHGMFMVAPFKVGF